MTPDRIEFVSRAGPSGPLPAVLLDAVASNAATGWLRRSLTRFAAPVAAVIPGHFAAYVRIYHPFGDPAAASLSGPGLRRWNMLASHPVRTAEDGASFARQGPLGTQAPTGTVPRALVEPLVLHLSPAIPADDQYFFALWEGFADSVVAHGRAPTLELPHRRYHVFTGSLASARSSYSSIPFSYRSPNLWWPADRAWCVATEVDAAWTYVGGSRELIDRLLTDSRIDAVRTSATAPW